MKIEDKSNMFHHTLQCILKMSKVKLIKIWIIHKTLQIYKILLSIKNKKLKQKIWLSVQNNYLELKNLVDHKLIKVEEHKKGNSSKILRLLSSVFSICLK